MSKKIHTIQSSDKKEFDKTVNQFLESGGELMDNGYHVINSDDGLIYSQVIVFKNCDVEFYEDGQLKSVENNYEDGERKWDFTEWYDNGQKQSKTTMKDGKLDGVWDLWYENGQKKHDGKYKGGKEDGLHTLWYENGQKKSEGTFKGGETISEKEWNEDGSVKE